MPLTLRILFGLMLGIGLGAGLAAFDVPWRQDAVSVAAPVGRLWLNALQMTIVPLVFALIVTGVSRASGSANAGGMTARAVGLFAVLLLGAASFAALLTPLLLELWPIPEGAAAALRPEGASAVPPVPPISEWLLSFIPANPVGAAAEGAMVPIVVFALLFGLAATRIETRGGERLLGLFQAVVDTMMVLVGWVLWTAPLGVFALGFGVGSRVGFEAVGVFLHYIAIIVLVLVALILLIYGIVVVLGRIGIGRFARVAAGPQLVAFGTQSSLATLPAMVEAAKGLGISESARDVVLPLAVSLFRMTSPAGNLAVAIYVMHASGIDLAPSRLLVGVGVAALVSLAAVGLPSQISFFTTIAPISLAMGVPIAALPLLLAVETIPDLFRTVGNVTADMAAARIIGRREET